MRYLNQVKPHEKFVASGVYHSTLTGVDEQREEAWSIHQLPDDTWFIRADYQEKRKNGLNRLVEVLYEPDAEDRTIVCGVTRLNVFEYDSQVRVRQNLVFFDKYVQVGFSINDADRVYLEFDLPEQYAVAGASYIMRGLHMPSLVETSIPTLLDFDWQKRELVWSDDYTMTETSHDEIRVDGKPIPAVRYEWQLGADEKRTFWLDHHAVTLKVETAHEITTLNSYSRRPEPKS